MKTKKYQIKQKEQRKILNDLNFNLYCEVLTYRKLLQLASEIQEALLSDKIKYLLKVALKQEELAKKLGAHEKKRMVLIEKLAASFALPKKTLSLSQLISLVKEPYATNYANIRNELHSLISKLDALCFQNARLIESNIKYIDEMLFLLATLNEEEYSTYLCTGKIDNSQYNPRVLDYNL